MKLDNDVGGSAPTNLSVEIRRLKTEGKSLRATIESSEKVVTRGRGEGLPSIIEGRGNVVTASNNLLSRESRKSGEDGNQVVTKKIPSHTPTEGVTPLETPSAKATEDKRGVSARVFSEADDLVGVIKGFLEANGILVYPIQVAAECYQVEYNGQVVRFYVQRNNRV
jgi:hypothetical protein